VLGAVQVVVAADRASGLEGGGEGHAVTHRIGRDVRFTGLGPDSRLDLGPPHQRPTHGSRTAVGRVPRATTSTTPKAGTTAIEAALESAMVGPHP